MRVTRIDERRVTTERTRSDFVVLVYETPVRADASWSVDSHLVEDATLPEVLGWLEEYLPDGCCWSLGVATPDVDDSDGSSERDLAVSWIIGADVLNVGPREPDEEHLAAEMLARRSSVVVGPVGTAGQGYAVTG